VEFGPQLLTNAAKTSAASRIVVIFNMRIADAASLSRKMSRPPSAKLCHRSGVRRENGTVST
jgi:hypothetical protein